MGKYGNNVTALLQRFIAVEAIPDGGGVESGFRFLTDASHRKQVLEAAESKMLAALAVVKTAPDNPYGNDDELIAAELLKRIAERENAQEAMQHGEIH